MRTMKAQGSINNSLANKTTPELVSDINNTICEIVKIIETKLLFNGENIVLLKEDDICLISDSTIKAFDIIDILRKKVK